MELYLIEVHYTKKKINMVLQCREHALGPPHTHMQNTAKIML